jgi:glycerol-3-phosphate dehydrogenase (NAD(P)+)
MRGDEAARRAATGHPIVTMGGGGLAGELGPGQPTFLVAGGDAEPAGRIASLLRGPGLRVETTDDAAGVALCAALKNAYALGLAIFETGVPMGDNGRGAFMRIALHELSGLCALLGGRPETALGPAGLGDLVTTALSVRSRNRRLGEMLAAGKSLEDGIAELHHRPEGLDALAFAIGRPEILPAHFPLLHAIHAALAGELLPGRTLFGMGKATA